MFGLVAPVQECHRDDTRTAQPLSIAMYSSYWTLKVCWVCGILVTLNCIWLCYVEIGCLGEVG